MKENFTLVVLYENVKKSITFNLNDDFLTFKSKIDSNFDISRKPYDDEIIERRSSNETLEDLLKRRIKVENFYIFCKDFIIDSHNYSDFIGKKKDIFVFG